MTIIAALLLAAAPVQPAPTPAWLAGVWKVESDSSRQDEGACTGDDALRCAGAATAASSTATSTVRPRGDRRLTTTGRPTERIGDTAGAAQQSRVERLGRNRMRLTDPDGERLMLTRCR